MEYIKVENLKDGYLYEIVARNTRYGIFRKEHGDFVFIRRKFNDRYLFSEIHYDLSEHFGTAKPISEVIDTPFKEKDLDYDNLEPEKYRKIMKYLDDVLN